MANVVLLTLYLVEEQMELFVEKDFNLIVHKMHVDHYVVQHNSGNYQIYQNQIQQDLVKNVHLSLQDVLNVDLINTRIK